MTRFRLRPQTSSYRNEVELPADLQCYKESISSRRLLLSQTVRSLIRIENASLQWYPMVDSASSSEKYLQPLVSPPHLLRPHSILAENWQNESIKGMLYDATLRMVAKIENPFFWTRLPLKARISAVTLFEAIQCAESASLTQLFAITVARGSTIGAPHSPQIVLNKNLHIKGTDIAETEDEARIIMAHTLPASAMVAPESAVSKPPLLPPLIPPFMNLNMSSSQSKRVNNSGMLKALNHNIRSFSLSEQIIGVVKCNDEIGEPFRGFSLGSGGIRLRKRYALHNEVWMTSANLGTHLSFGSLTSSKDLSAKDDIGKFSRLGFENDFTELKGVTKRSSDKLIPILTNFTNDFLLLVHNKWKVASQARRNSPRLSEAVLLRKSMRPMMKKLLSTKPAQSVLLGNDYAENKERAVDCSKIVLPPFIRCLNTIWYSKNDTGISTTDMLLASISHTVTVRHEKYNLQETDDSNHNRKLVSLTRKIVPPPFKISRSVFGNHRTVSEHKSTATDWFKFVAKVISSEDYTPGDIELPQSVLMLKEIQSNPSLNDYKLVSSKNTQRIEGDEPPIADSTSGFGGKNQIKANISKKNSPGDATPYTSKALEVTEESPPEATRAMPAARQVELQLIKKRSSEFFNRLDSPKPRKLQEEYEQNVSAMLYPVPCNADNTLPLHTRFSNELQSFSGENLLDEYLFLQRGGMPSAMKTNPKSSYKFSIDKDAGRPIVQPQSSDTSSEDLTIEDKDKRSQEFDAKEPRLLAFVKSNFLNQQSSIQNHANGSENARLLKLLREKYSISLVDCDEQLLMGNGVVQSEYLSPSRVDFVLGECTALCIIRAGAGECSSMESVRNFAKDLLVNGNKDALRYDTLWVVVELFLLPEMPTTLIEAPRRLVASAFSTNPSFHQDGEGLTRSNKRRRKNEEKGNARRAQPKSNLPKDIKKAENSQGVEENSTLPTAPLSRCLTQLCQSLWSFPCAVQVHYSWNTEDTANIIRLAADAAADAALSRDPAHNAEKENKAVSKLTEDSEAKFSVTSIDISKKKTKLKNNESEENLWNSKPNYDVDKEAEATLKVRTAHAQARCAAILDVLESCSGFNNSMNETKGLSSVTPNEMQHWMISLLAGTPFLNCYSACIILHAFSGDIGLILSSSKDELYERVPLTVPRYRLDDFYAFIHMEQPVPSLEWINEPIIATSTGEQNLSPDGTASMIDMSPDLSIHQQSFSRNDDSMAQASPVFGDESRFDSLVGDAEEINNGKNPFSQFEYQSTDENASYVQSNYQEDLSDFNHDVHNVENDHIRYSSKDRHSTWLFDEDHAKIRNPPLGETNCTLEYHSTERRQSQVPKYLSDHHAYEASPNSQHAWLAHEPGAIAKGGERFINDEEFNSTQHQNDQQCYREPQQKGSHYPFDHQLAPPYYQCNQEEHQNRQQHKSLCVQHGNDSYYEGDNCDNTAYRSLGPSKWQHKIREDRLGFRMNSHLKGGQSTLYWSPRRN